MTRRPDPAPSRWRYRLDRLLMRRWVRRGLRLGLPVLLLAGLGFHLVSDPKMQAEAAAAAEAARGAVLARPELQVTRIAVRGTREIPEEMVREVIPLALPQPAPMLDVGELRARIEALDAVARARVRVRPDGVLDVVIAERVPAAIWRHRGRLVLVDQEGFRVAALARRAARPDLPLIVGPAAAEAVGEALVLAGAADTLGPRIRGFVRVGARRWDLVLDRGQRIL
ncbi:MAG: cell division protein FtsQ/DivIB, partial [Pseudomonadota bacterium]